MASNDPNKLFKLQRKLKELQAAQRVDDRKWQMRIELVEAEIRRVVEGRR